MNLAVNARDAMPQGGRLIFETANVEFPLPSNPAPIELKPGKYIMLRASDTGCGMSDEVRAQAFDPFFTTKELGRGTGLGLSTVYGIVKQSDGYIFIDTAQGRGTTFTIYLPRIDEAVATSDVVRTSKASVSQVSKTILVVEDEQPVRALVRHVLASKGICVLEAENGTVAENICRDYKGPIDLLLTDSVMPGIDGPELASRVTLLRPQMKIAFMSGYSGDDAFRGQISAPDTNFLAKPFTPQALLQLVLKACGEPAIS
jgi:CheY-like chemotaxis protein